VNPLRVSVGELVEAQAARRPSQPFLTFGDGVTHIIEHSRSRLLICDEGTAPAARLAAERAQMPLTVVELGSGDHDPGLLALLEPSRADERTHAGKRAVHERYDRPSERLPTVPRLLATDRPGGRRFPRAGTRRSRTHRAAFLLHRSALERDVHAPRRRPADRSRRDSTRRR
jgi:hypothetical protein